MQITPKTNSKHETAKQDMQQQLYGTFAGR